MPGSASRPAFVLLVVALIVPASAGCLGTTGPDADQATDPAGPTLEAALDSWTRYRARLDAEPDAEVPRIAVDGHPSTNVTVAVVDTGVNPFHEYFRNADRMAPGSLPVAAVDAATGQKPYYVPIQPTDSVPEWPAKAVEPGTLYRFGGTNLLFYSVMDEVETLDYAGHGTSTSATVLSQAPDANVVMVQATGETLADGIGWAIAQPWIDIVSVSWGCGYNCAPFYPVDALTVSQFADLSRQAWSEGKVWVNSAGNDPTPHVTDSVDGPPWVVAVGGSEPTWRGEVPDSSDLPDVVSNWTVEAPAADSTEEMGTHQGTSFAAPTVAGTLARALHTVRERTGHDDGLTADGLLVDAGEVQVDNADLRTALNRSAVYWAPGDYEPGAPPVEDPDDTPAPINPVAPWVQMGWGYVNATLSPTIADALLTGELPAKSEEARMFMHRLQEVRRVMWAS